MSFPDLSHSPTSEPLVTKPDSDRSTLVRQECDTLAFTFCNISDMNTLTPHRKAKDTSTQPRRILPRRKEFPIENRPKEMPLIRRAKYKRGKWTSLVLSWSLGAATCRST